jgi:NAD(P)-dependent dehydrogenase (short-subunit alcohol dehydrogenase family)
MKELSGQVALVTGASRGVGRGVADALARASAQVYATGRTVMDTTLDPAVVRVMCDHTDPASVDALFDRIQTERGGLDILNSAWGGYERMVEDGVFTWPLPVLGAAVAALAHDADRLRWSGQVLVAAALASEYGFTDIDGRSPRALTLADV